MKRGQTPSQTVGPFFAYGLTPEQYGYPALASIASADLRTPDADGERIRLEGRVLDGQEEPVEDAMIEIWQANPQGRYPDPADARDNIAFKGFGRCGTGTDPERRFVFETLKPGTVDERQAPHINVIVFMRGLLNHLYTRVYFADEAANARDLVLQSVPPERRATLIAPREEKAGVTVYRFDIHMQGERETVFFDV